ncbi:hypothetical protein [Demequina sp. NBRC 110055]|uniref:hypothetical protein n=1 Tax=Demequina sp. NBRC 110055 TaxID=1570344 RepID=UPI0009FD4BD3|nr:hypothetical protein [Demequina sp. NBRC 110055]
MTDQELAAVVAVIIAVSAVIHAGLAVVGFMSRRRAGAGASGPAVDLRGALAAGRWRLTVITVLHAIPLTFATSLAVVEEPKAIMMAALWIGALAFALIGVVGIAMARLGADQPGGPLLSRVVGLGALIGGALVFAVMATVGG